MSPKPIPNLHPPRIGFRQTYLWLLTAFVLTGAARADPGLSSQPLAPHTAKRGATLFAKLSPQETGIFVSNNYADPRVWSDLSDLLVNGSFGSGVAIGDFDNDNKPDILVVSKMEGCRLFRNLGGYRFEDVTAKAGILNESVSGMWYQGATFVDVNNDGLLDIYVCRYNAPNLLYINQGDGTFKEMAHSYGLDVKDCSVMAAFCDYDRDGWLDVFITTNLFLDGHGEGRRSYLFHNNRDGTFSDVTEKAGMTDITRGHSATWWDYDNDGWPDLYVANDFAPYDRLYHNNGNGTFRNVIDDVIPHVPYSAMGADLADVTNDGLFDLFVADMAATTHEKDQRRSAALRSTVGYDNQLRKDANPQVERNALYINTGTGYFMEAAFLAGVAATDWSWSPRFEDFDNDGRIDLFVTNGMMREFGNVDLLERISKSPSLAEMTQITRNSPVLKENHIAFRNLGDLRFEDVSASWGLNENGVGLGTALGDLDGTGNVDIVYTNFGGNVTVMRNDCDSGHRVNIFLRGTVSNRFGVGATVRIESSLGSQVRQLVLARGYMSSSEPMLHFGLGGDTSISTMTVTWPSGLVQTFHDLPADRRFTVTEPSGPAPHPAERARPKGQFEEVGEAMGLSLQSREDATEDAGPQPLIPLQLNRRGPSLVVADLNAGKSDSLVIGGTTRDPLRLLGSDEHASVWTERETPLVPGTAVDDGPLLVFDATGQGSRDLLVTRGGNPLPAGSPEYQPILLLNDGHGHFAAAPAGALPPVPVSTGAAAAADFDHSGRLGLFIGARLQSGSYPLAPRSALLANRGGRFEDVTDALAPGLRNVGMVTSALWTDVDGDGWPDLLLTLEWGKVTYFHNNQGKGFEDWTDRAGFGAAGVGWWTSLAAADFNEDGRPDYVVGNVGLNTQYHADKDHPSLLFYGNFNDEDTEPQLVEAYYEGDRLYPRRTQKDLSSAIPRVRKRYPKNNDYARATLGEILGEDKLAAATRFAATELRSGIFLSQPDGTYRFEPLPRIAQVAPLQGMVAGDFEGSGHADLYALQNSYAPIPAVGRFDGGLSQLLRGDGKGHLVPVPALESGLVVPGDAKAVVALPLGGTPWPGFVVSRNSAATLAFRNRGVAGHQPFVVRLRGRPGNPTAVGARVTLEYTDGATQACEIYAGSSYYSQSTEACLFGYADSNPPRVIRVRWPDGTASQTAFTPGATHAEISPP